jgi:RimJ/RimL family protein N-acetyltransferase
VTGVELREITMDDLPLYERMARDPRMMAELGGPLPPEGLEEKLRGIVESVREGSSWYFTIVPHDVGAPVGTICIWEHDEDGESIDEIGWMVAPEFQGRGLASEALRSILAKARAEGRWSVIHAYPGVTNAPSNALCRKAGFQLLGQSDIEYAGRTLRCNHWRIDLRSTSHPVG